LDESRNLRLQTEQAIMLEYQQTVSEFLISLNTVKNNSEQRHLANKIYKNSIKKFKLGVQESYVLSQHQAQYFVSLTNYYSALNELIDKYITLKRLMNNL
jgi:outer membrane protein TolC